MNPNRKTSERTDPRSRPAPHAWLGAEVRDEADVHAQLGSAVAVGLLTPQHLLDQRLRPN